MNEDTKYQKIQDYLEGRLSSPELDAFENELKSDPDLQMEVDLQRLSGDAIELLVEENLRGELKDLHREMQGQSAPQTKVRSLRRRIVPLSIAASILLVIGFFAANYTAGQYDNDSLAADFYDNDLLQRVRGNNSASLLQEGMDFYESGNYTEALTYLDGVTDPNLKAEAEYAAAHAHYNLGQYQEAMDNFETVMNSNDPRFTEKAEYYYLLSSLAGNQTNTEKFNNTLDKILNDEAHLHHKDALKLNKKLKSFWRNF